MKPEPILIESRTVPPPDTNIRSVEPILGSIRGQNYLGRVFIEVWDKDAHVLIAPEIPALTARALTALEDQSAWGEVKHTPWPDQPLTGEITGQTFLGRVVVEVWDEVAVVGITGSDSRVKKQAIQALKAHRTS